jgi:hypothetical protein
MEPFSERLSGSFLKNILKSSVPAGIFLALCAVIPYTLGIFGFTEYGLQLGILSLNLGSILVFFYVARPLNKYRLFTAISVFVFTFAVVLLPAIFVDLERFFFVVRSADLVGMQPIDVLIGMFGVSIAYFLYERIR